MQKIYSPYRNKPKQRGATSLLEVLFVLIVAMAFAMGLYRQFSSASLEKAATERNQEVATVIKIANIFYFSVDPATVSDTINTPVRFCNEQSYLNTFQAIGTIPETLCPQLSTTDNVACKTIQALVKTIDDAATARNEAYSIIIGQKDINASPKFIGVLLENKNPEQRKGLFDEAVFKLYKGKIMGNPQYIDSGNPLTYVSKSVSNGAIFWVFPPSQANSSTSVGSKLNNVNMQALNNLTTTWIEPKAITNTDYHGYAFACQDNYQH